MSTLTIPSDRLHLDLAPGDRLIAIDGHTLPAPRVIDNPYHWVGAQRAVSLVNALGTDTEWNIYPGNVEVVIVERGDAEPEVAPAPEPTRPAEGTIVTLTTPKGTRPHLTKVAAPGVYGYAAEGLCGTHLGVNISHVGAYGQPWDGTADGICPRCAQIAIPAPPVARRRRRKPAQPTGLRRIAPGVYEHPDGQYRVERMDSLGDGWSQARQTVVVETTSSMWVVTERPAREDGEWEEVSLEQPTKRAAVADLEEILRKNASQR